MCGVITKAKIVIIENPQNRIEEAVNKLSKILE
jgi:adenylate kinase